MKLSTKLSVAIWYADRMTWGQVNRKLTFLYNNKVRVASLKHRSGKTIRRRATDDERRYGKALSALDRMMLIKKVKSQGVLMLDIVDSNFGYETLDSFLYGEVKWQTNIK